MIVNSNTTLLRATEPATELTGAECAAKAVAQRAEVRRLLGVLDPAACNPFRGTIEEVIVELAHRIDVGLVDLESTEGEHVNAVLKALDELTDLHHAGRRSATPGSRRHAEATELFEAFQAAHMVLVLSVGAVCNRLNAQAEKAEKVKKAQDRELEAMAHSLEVMRAIMDQSRKLGSSVTPEPASLPQAKPAPKALVVKQAPTVPAASTQLEVVKASPGFARRQVSFLTSPAGTAAFAASTALMTTATAGGLVGAISTALVVGAGALGAKLLKPKASRPALVVEEPAPQELSTTGPALGLDELASLEAALDEGSLPLKARTVLGELTELIEAVTAHRGYLAAGDAFHARVVQLAGPEAQEVLASFAREDGCTEGAADLLVESLEALTLGAEHLLKELKRTTPSELTEANSVLTGKYGRKSLLQLG
jgi:hypothetical protein